MKNQQIFVVSNNPIGEKIRILRGQKVIFDQDLARLYGVTTKRLNQQVARNKHRFPSDFAFQLTSSEMSFLRLHSATSKKGSGGRRYLPYVFTEHGAVMVSSVLNTKIAVEMSILIARAFVELRHIASNHRELLIKFDQLERKLAVHDQEIEKLFHTIRELMSPPAVRKSRIGFRSK